MKITLVIKSPVITGKESVTKWQAAPDGFLMSDETWKYGENQDLGIKTSKVVQSDIDAICANSDNAYTVWAAFRTNDSGISQWENVYAQTLIEKISSREFFQRRGVRPYATLVVNANGGEHVLILHTEKAEYLQGAMATDSIAQENLAAYIGSQFPTITLSKSEPVDGYVKVTAISSFPINGAELRWDATAGVLDASRTPFIGNETSVLLKLPVASAPVKVKCGFKYYTGIADISL